MPVCPLSLESFAASNDGSPFVGPASSLSDGRRVSKGKSDVESVVWLITMCRK